MENFQMFFNFLSRGAVVVFVREDDSCLRLVGEAVDALHGPYHHTRYRVAKVDSHRNEIFDYEDGSRNFAIFYHNDEGVLLEMIAAVAETVGAREPPNHIDKGEMVILRRRRGEECFVFECMTVPPEPQWTPPAELTSEELEEALSHYPPL